MRLLALGVDHRSAPTAIREALAFDGPRRDQALDALRAAFPSAEFVVLSTCNRVEVYAAADDHAAAPGPDDAAGFLARFHDVPAGTLAGHLVAHHDEGAVGHLFRVASSLESLVLGEGQILGQVRDAYKAADARRAVGPILHTLFREAIRVRKKVREETGMDRGKLSVASVAVDVAREVFDTFGDKAVLVIGAGKMADLTLQHLKGLGPGQIVVTNRSFPKAEAVAARWGGRALPFDRLGQALTEADVVVSTTAAEEPIVSYETYARVQRARRNRLALILDIAVPRDFDPRIGDLEQVMLYNVDDLRAQVERNLQGRRKGIDPARAIIERETAACLATLRHQRHAGTLLRQLGAYADEVRLREQETLYARLPHLSPADREAIAHTLHRLQNQFLHHPRTALRSAASAPPADHPHPLLSAVRHLFGLGDGPGHKGGGRPEAPPCRVAPPPHARGPAPPPRRRPGSSRRVAGSWRRRRPGGWWPSRRGSGRGTPAPPRGTPRGPRPRRRLATGPRRSGTGGPSIAPGRPTAAPGWGRPAPAWPWAARRRPSGRSGRPRRRAPASSTPGSSGSNCCGWKTGRSRRCGSAGGRTGRSPRRRGGPC